MNLYLIDTNILIYFYNGHLSKDQKLKMNAVFQNSFNISVITKIEFLGFKGFTNRTELETAQEFIKNANIIGLSDQLVDSIINLRRFHRIKLGDAIIATTALASNYTLITKNKADFKNIRGLKLDSLEL